MKQRVFIFDLERCFGCYGCVAACVNANATPPGLFWRQLHKLPPPAGDFHTVYLSLACNHCGHAPCVEACPTEAMIKRTEDGVVLHREDRCIGCRYCQMACPYDAIRWDEAEKIISKCIFCYERLDEGREPACVETCFGGALSQMVIEIPDSPYEYRHEVPGFAADPVINPSIRFITSDMHRPDRRKKFPPSAGERVALTQQRDEEEKSDG